MDRLTVSRPYEPQPALRSDGRGSESMGAEEWQLAGPLLLQDDAGIELLKGILQRHGYGEPGMFKRLGLSLGRQPARLDLPLYLRRLRESVPGDTLIRLLYLADSVGLDEAEAAFAPIGWRRFEDLGLLAQDGQRVRATCAISPHAHLRLTHDLMEPRTMESRADYVLGLNPAARLLAAMTPREPVRSLLDVGTGCGVQAFLAAAHCPRVLATDICPRALHFATFNAKLNGITNVEFRLGSLFESVAGERFDLVISNPPYVISPDRDYVFRDGGLPGEGICARLVRQTGAYLAEGGLAVVLVHWPNSRTAIHEAWDGPVRRWLVDSGCDAWIIRREVDDPLTYAADWNRQPDVEKYAAALDRWQAYFDAEDVKSISMGVLVLRRRTGGRNWIRAEDTQRGGMDGFELQIRRLFAAMDFLAAHPSDDDLKSVVFRPAPDHEVVRTLVPRGTTYETEQSRLRMPRGLCFEGSLDEAAVRMLSLLDGRRTLAEVAKMLSGEAGLDPTACANIAAGLARRFVVLGFLVPVQGATYGGALSPRGGSEDSPLHECAPAGPEMK